MIFGFKKKVTEAKEAEQPEEVKVQAVPEELLEIDHELGLSYCMNMEDFYQEMKNEFCNQAAEYLPQLEEYYNAQNWKQYAVVAHGLKGNSLNIGASNFSKLSLQHEMAGKEENVDFIRKEYAAYVQALKALMEKLQ